MSNYKGYKQEDNLRRKANNTTDELGWGPNNNAKSYSTKPGQMRMQDQAKMEADKYKKLNRQQPVRKLTKEEIEALYGKAI
jgi:hypothetical protein